MTRRIRGTSVTSLSDCAQGSFERRCTNRSIEGVLGVDPLRKLPGSTTLRSVVSDASMALTFPPELIQSQSGIRARIMEDTVMPRKRFTAEQFVNKLREANGLISQCQTVAQVHKQLGITDQTF